MNIIWLALLSVSIVFAIFTGNLEPFTKSIFEGAKSAVEISLFLLGIVSIWMGITRILEDSGLIYRIAHIFRPIISRLFRNIPKDHPSITPITLNVLANLFGLGNAATPLGIKAMQDLDTLNENKGTITFEMMIFIIINTASIQLIPFSVIGILAVYGAKNPAAIVLPVLIATVISAVTALLILFSFRKILK
ncbi:MAG TPA: spore maturation protein [Candidatus Margulisbacteria bacterium]|nr:MAG: spore maturation protein [Candidatus Margulisbacteria bacterium GWD2_39_127]OGI06557.1 MAG: spore maturation protein [Candidatus Margulisbacteria bacterium GWE2_39_32]HAR64094.1 spore maturation protein [Candidatus Margulisiibacteriota bacterium]HCT85275.1 spore maturation protein [Candidatus Margulisiibacteriota bacterium]